MKEKIEKLIKEIGVNEVESKVNVKQELKKDFVELLTGCTISFDSDVIDYKKDGEWFFYHQKTDNNFYLRYKIWSNFKSKYNLNNQELSDLLVDIVEDVLNYKGVTPATVGFPNL
jgi:hypothetical protein